MQFEPSECDSFNTSFISEQRKIIEFQLQAVDIFPQGCPSARFFHGQARKVWPSHEESSRKMISAVPVGCGRVLLCESFETLWRLWPRNHILQ